MKLLNSDCLARSSSFFNCECAHTNLSSSFSNQARKRCFWRLVQLCCFRLRYCELTIDNFVLRTGAQLGLCRTEIGCLRFPRLLRCRITFGMTLLWHPLRVGLSRRRAWFTRSRGTACSRFHRQRFHRICSSRRWLVN